MSNDARLEHDREILLKRINTMEAQILSLREDLIRSNRLATLGTLAGMVVHEFNNLLTHMSGYAQLAISKPEDHKLVEKALERTVDGTEQLTRISSAILGYLKNDAEMQTSDINVVLDEVIVCLARDPDKEKVKLERNITPNLRVIMRPICLQQVFLNLIINSIEAMRPNGGTITICAEKTSDDRCEIKVIDTGKGIPANIVDKVFQPLISENNSNQYTSTSKGHGLGLSICHYLINEAKGNIEFESLAGRGTTFIIHLPTDNCLSD